MAGTLIVSTLGDGTGTVPTTTVIAGAAKAWVNFNGTGTVAIRDDFNVSSITDNGTGFYSVNFTSGPSTVNYAVSACADARTGFGDGITNLYQTDMTTSLFKIYSRDDTATNFDATIVQCVVHWN